MWERAIRLKQRLTAGEVVYGAWLNVTDPSVAEIIAGAGFDYVLIDGEHAPWTLDKLAASLMAFRSGNTVPIYRVAWNDPVMIKQALDLGAEGIMAPMVKSAEEALRLVKACRYPPDGERGFGPRRASDYYRDVPGYLAAANVGVFIMPQIEHIDSVEGIDDILAVEGIDAICLGPADISGSAGLFMQLDHPVVTGALEKVLARAKFKGIPACSGVPLAAHVQAAWIDKGARMALVTSDTAVLVTGFACALVDVREALARLRDGGPLAAPGEALDAGWRVG